MTRVALLAAATRIHGRPLPVGATAYPDPDDYAGLGYPHRLVAWQDEDGTPRSIVVPV